MSVITDLDDTFQSKTQAEDAFVARSHLENASNTILELNAKIQKIIDSGNFNTIPADLKQALNRWWIIYKDAQIEAEADAEIVDIFQWRPNQ